MPRRQTAQVRVGSAEFKTRCLEFVDRVKESRTEFIVTRHGTPVARLVPIGRVESASLLGSMADSVLRYDGPFEPAPAVWSLDRPHDED